MAVNMIVFEYREEEEKFFEENKFENFNIIFYKECLTPEFLEMLPQDLKDSAAVISVFINSDVSEEVINSFKNLRIISTRSTGYDHINISAAKSRNIAVVNVENYGETSVAQFTMGLMIALVRHILPAAMYIKKLQRDDDKFTGRDISKLTLGVIGTGAIGAAVCRAAKYFKMDVVAYDLKEKKELIDELGVRYMSLDELFSAADIVTLHIPYTGDNYHMVSSEKIKLMKDGALLINTSRGEIVDLPALFDAIESKKLGGAALDVLTCESINFGCQNLTQKLNSAPLNCLNEALYVERLSKFDNVIITPHIAYDTQDSVNLILEKSMSAVKDVISGGKATRIC